MWLSANAAQPESVLILGSWNTGSAAVPQPSASSMPWFLSIGMPSTVNQDFFVGQTVTIAAQPLQIVRADEHCLQFLEAVHWVGSALENKLTAHNSVGHGTLRNHLAVRKPQDLRQVGWVCSVFGLLGTESGKIQAQAEALQRLVLTSCRFCCLLGPKLPLASPRCWPLKSGADPSAATRTG